MNVYSIDRLQSADLQGLCDRGVAGVDDSTYEDVQVIAAEVKALGDEAVRGYTSKFDKVDLTEFRTTEEEINDAASRIAPAVQEAFEQAADNIGQFHAAQFHEGQSVETMPGVTCFTEARPIERVGLYIPGGTASLPSTALMLGIPAQRAGCKEIVLTTPPEKDGSATDIVLYAAKLCGITEVYKVGGPQAIAALAYGTETIPKVNKIFGPGNKFVTAAKMIVSTDPEGAAIDMPAGPTEVLVIADEAARADFVASDLLSQAEHGTDSQVVLVCTDEDKTQEILQEVDAQLATLPRMDIARVALQNSFALVVNDLQEALDFSNRYAPEHLILNTGDADDLVSGVSNAGSVFIGPYSCEAAGDYASGTNHCLPTYGYARSYSGVTIAAFQKQITFQRVTAEGAQALAPTVAIMAQQEGLEGHKRAMQIRA